MNNYEELHARADELRHLLVDAVINRSTSTEDSLYILTAIVEELQIYIEQLERESK